MSGTEYQMGDTLAGRYLIESRLGESPAAQTFLANENHSSQKIVLKVFRPGTSAKLLQEPDFFLKAAVQTTLQHDSLGLVFDITEHDNQIVVAREYVEGESFEDLALRLASQGGGLVRGMELLWQVAQGLNYLHENHRHLRIHPRNLILSPMGAKLVDSDPRALPLSDLIPESLPTRSEYLGYQAPEVRDTGFVAYPNTDLFSLAGLLYRLVVGANPHQDGRTSHQALQSCRVDREIENFLVKAMHPRSEDRYASAESFSEALWALQPYLERLQTSAPRQVPVLHVDPPSAEFIAPVFTAPPPKKSGTEFGAPAFPTTPSFASSLEAPMREPTLFGSIPAPDPFSPNPTAKGSETFFGNAPTPPAKVQTDFFAKPAPQGRAPTEFSFKPPVANPQPFQPPKPIFEPVQARPAFQPPPPPPPPPVARMSSLESDTSDLTLSGSEKGMTQFGFKNADGNRTGDFGQEAVRRKHRLILILSIVASLGVVVILVVFYFVLRAAAPQPHIAQQDALGDPVPLTETLSPANANSNNGNATAQTTSPSAQKDEPPFPETSSNPQPDYEDALTERDHPSQALAKVKAPTLATPPPSATVPVKTTPVVTRPEPTPVMQQPVASNSRPMGNSKITPARSAELDAAFKARQWPGTARDRLQMADDFNDLGRTSEANMVYQKVLEVSDVTSKERTLALGGMAITFKNMGMKSEALRAVESLLSLNPRNRFALGLKAELQ